MQDKCINKKLRGLLCCTLVAFLTCLSKQLLKWRLHCCQMRFVMNKSTKAITCTTFNNTCMRKTPCQAGLYLYLLYLAQRLTKDKHEGWKMAPQVSLQMNSQTLWLPRAKSTKQPRVWFRIFEACVKFEAFELLMSLTKTKKVGIFHIKTPVTAREYSLKHVSVTP